MTDTTDTTPTPASLPTLRLLGHGGMIDRLCQLTSAAGADISTLRGMLDTDEQREQLQRIYDLLVQVDDVVSLTRQAGYENALAETTPDDPERSRQYLAGRLASPSGPGERDLLEWVVRVSPRRP